VPIELKNFSPGVSGSAWVRHLPPIGAIRFHRSDDLPAAKPSALKYARINVE